MPNGNQKFHEEEFPALELFFAPIADVLNEFASRHNLSLEKYWHQISSWRFNFRHPKGGVASVDVMKESDNCVKIYNYWWIDDFDKFTRSARHDETKEYKIESANLNDILEEQFKKILSWQLDEWTEIVSGYEPHWSPYKERLVNYVERYPIPKV